MTNSGDSDEDNYENDEGETAPCLGGMTVSLATLVMTYSMMDQRTTLGMEEQTSIHAPI